MEKSSCAMHTSGPRYLFDVRSRDKGQKRVTFQLLDAAACPGGPFRGQTGISILGDPV